ncbi:hypothetical protein Dimus_014952 [Dionaea muscipula]
MAMQTGMGLSKIIILVGVGYSGTILLKNGKLSDLLGELQAMVKGLEKSGDSSTNADSDPIAAQVRWLAQEVRQLASARQITVLNGSSGGIDITSLIIPVGALSVVGYGYMWWKGFSFSDLMYVTKKNMEVAVSSLTKNLEGVSEAVAKAKMHLTQRIENLDGKVEYVKETTKSIENEVRNTRDDLSRIGSEFLQLKNTVESLDEKVSTIESKQNLTILGLDYLCNFAAGRPVPNYEKFLQDQIPVKLRGQLPSFETSFIQGLKDIADNFPQTKKIGDGSVTRTSSIKLAITGM